ncbi:translation initiation factor 2 [Paenibacillus paeoniae]|uniref:Translation initiation factor 2 n=1 Tax=Paenibacillus paeoniae TaxID=2292705 RepID=A0A371PMK8_9BACL|nr:translation initiation factor 2 [Paenibacillus paeoniae]REK77432.1 translation initiation factor 2 [Paenibacillus paeoniae]
MRGNAWKWLAIGGAIALLVMFGLEMSTTGIERIYGPIDGSEYTVGTGNSGYVSETDKRITELERELEEIRRIAYGNGYEGEGARLPGMPLQNDQPAVNKLADSTSGLLQTASSKSIRFVVGLFDGWMN